MNSNDIYVVGQKIFKKCSHVATDRGKRRYNNVFFIRLHGDGKSPCKAPCKEVKNKVRDLDLAISYYVFLR